MAERPQRAASPQNGRSMAAREIPIGYRFDAAQESISDPAQ
jgi:hypothetical protein